jgi:ubiquinone/menaquinone biosynthesis C-methylase UbiE
MSEELSLLVDLHRGAERHGPGSDAITLRAMTLAGLTPAPLKIADIGCGTGASTLLLAEQLGADITAVDFLPDFIGELNLRAERRGLSGKITPLVCSMDELPFGDEEFDVIWSEGAIYNIGFERGARDWARFLKPGGVLVASEVTWTTAARPNDIQSYWDAAYPEIDTASSKIAVLENCGYSPLGYFTLPQECWLENYYRPIQNSFEEFLERNNHSDGAKAIVAAEREEIEMYENNCSYYSYGMYIAQKRFSAH